MKKINNFFRTTSGHTNTQLVYAVTFTIIAVVALVGLVMIRSQADTTSESASIPNATPTLSGLAFAVGGSTVASAGTVTLTEGTTTAMTIQVTGADNNGCTDIDTTASWTATVYRSDVSGGASCTADNNNCYRETIASGNLTGCSGGEDDDIVLNLADNFQYYADPTDSNSPAHAGTDWTVSVTATDENGAATVTSSQNFEVATQTALNVTSSVNYGSLAVGATSASDSNITVENTGNRDIDYSVGGTALTCDAGTSIGVGYVKYARSANTAYGSMTAMTAAASATSIDANIAKATSSTAQNDAFYTKISIPKGAYGACTGALTFTAASGS